MTRNHRERGELRRALHASRHALLVVAFVSAVLNVLALGGSIYMMLVYDSVLPSRSVATLAALFAMVLAIYAFQAVFDTLRGRMLADIGARMERRVAPRLKQLSDLLAQRRQTGEPLPDAMREFDQVRNYIAGAGPAALMDMPWILFYLGLLMLLHPWLGLATLAGALVLVGLTLYADRRVRRPTETVSRVAGERRALLDERQRHGEVIRAMGMGGRLWRRWDASNAQLFAAQADLARTAGLLGTASRVFRMLLQSAVLTVGALLVLRGDATGGIIFASSTIASRALAPIDQLAGTWKAFAAARTSWGRLEALFAAAPQTAAATVRLPAPRAALTVENLTVVPPGARQPAVRNLSFTLAAGDALSVMGMSAAGKSTLARALANAWAPAQGQVRLDGAALTQWDAEELGAHIGYLPQSVELLTGTIAENIARFRTPIDSEAVVEAARAAGVHDMIVAMPDGYDTFVGREGAALSAGQRQRIGLARALYGNPFLVVLDEPNSNLDVPGERALDRAIQGIRERGGIAIVVAHRTGVVARCSHGLTMRDGTAVAFGPVDQIFGRGARDAQGRDGMFPVVGGAKKEVAA